MYDPTVAAFKAVNSEVVIDFIPMARVVWSVVEDKYEANLGVMEWFAKKNKDHLVEFIDLINVNIKIFYNNDRFPDGLSYENLNDLKEDKIVIGCSNG